MVKWCELVRKNLKLSRSLAFCVNLNGQLSRTLKLIVGVDCRKRICRITTVFAKPGCSKRECD